MNGVLAIQSRIHEIQARLGISNPVSVIGAAPATASSGTTAGPVSGSTFASALDSATRADGAAGAAATGGDVIAAARKYLGVAYRWGGTDPATGLDCSGLVQRVFADLGIDVPRVVADQQNAGREVGSMAAAQPGDLLVWRGSPNHVGIYVGDGKMLHSPKTGDVVKISDVRRGEPDTIRRLTGDASPVAGSVTTAASAVPFGSLFASAEQRYSLPVGLLGAVARQESGFDPDAVSPAGALGLMQFMPGTAADLGIDPRDPVQAVDGAGRYLKSQLDAFGTVPLALAAYNAGPGAVRSHGGIPPYDETRHYVSSITAMMSGART